MRTGIESWEGKLTGVGIGLGGVVLTALTGVDLFGAQTTIPPEVTANVAKTAQDVAEYYKSLQPSVAVELMKTVRYGMVLLFIYGLSRFYINKRTDLKIEALKSAGNKVQQPIP